jgi:hypothetical protein
MLTYKVDIILEMKRSLKYKIMIDDDELHVILSIEIMNQRPVSVGPRQQMATFQSSKSICDVFNPAIDSTCIYRLVL